MSGNDGIARRGLRDAAGLRIWGGRRRRRRFGFRRWGGGRLEGELHAAAGTPSLAPQQAIIGKMQHKAAVWTGDLYGHDPR